MKEKIPNPRKMKRVKGPRVSPDELKTAKIRITTYIDEDILLAIKEAAGDAGSKYQTLLNQLLRQSLMGSGQTFKDRLERLEKAVFKKRSAQHL